jgi:hypothetical protein
MRQPCEAEDPSLEIAPQMRLLVAVEPADFRRGIDGRVRVCREALGADPFPGAVFVCLGSLLQAFQSARARSSTWLAVSGVARIAATGLARSAIPRAARKYRLIVLLASS